MGVCHRACALAQDQTGLLISGLSFSDGLIPCETLEQAQDALEGQRVPILLPSRIIFDLNPIEKTWDVTSDAVAAWFAWLVHATWLVILTDVDGIYYPPNMVGSQDHLLPEVSPERVREIGVSSVDACVPALLTQARLDCVILNGWRPNRLKDWFAGRPTIGTSIRTAQ